MFFSTIINRFLHEPFLIVQLIAEESTCNAGDPSGFLGQEDLLEKGQATHSVILGFPFVTQLVNNPPAMWETWAQSLGWENPLEMGKAMDFSILAWRIPWTIQSMGTQTVGHD